LQRLFGESVGIDDDEAEEVVYSELGISANSLV
jgi:hypothetical protein